MNHGKRAVLLASSTLAAALLTGCPWDSPETHLARGKDEAAKQKHAEAIIEFKNFLQSRPKSAEGRFLLGRELLAQGNFKAASIELQKAYDARYSRDDVLPLLAASQLSQGAFAEIASEVASGELGSAAANAELQSIFGSSLALQGKLDEALVAFRRAQEYLPGSTKALVGEAKIKAARGDLDGASATVAQVLSKEQGMAEALVLKGDVARARNQLPEAIEAYRQAIIRAPRNLGARIDLVSAYITTKQLDLAQAQINELKRLAPGAADVSYQDALVAFLKKDYVRAGEAVRLTLNETPNNGTAQILAGAIAMASGQPEQAELHLQEGLRLEPRSLYARGMLTRLYLNRREPQKADDVLRPAALAMSEDATFVTMAGEVAAQQGRFDEAAKLLAKASDLVPDNERLKVAVAEANFAKGDDAAAFAILESSAKSATKNPLPAISLVLARIQRGQLPQAVETWKVLQAEQPNDPMTYNLRAAIDFLAKDPEAGRKSLERALEIQPGYFPAIRSLASLDEEAGNFEKVRERYKAVIEKDNNNAQARSLLARFEAKHGAKPEVVLSLLKDALRGQPTAEQPVTELTAYYLNHGETAQAVTVAQDALSRSPNNLNFLALVGEIQLGTGNVDQALVTYRKLVTARPNVLSYQLGLGQAMIASKQFEPAMQVFLTAIKASPNAYPAQSIAVREFVRAQKPEFADRLIAEIRKFNPKSPVLVELEGDSKLGMKQYAEAAAIYRKVVAQSPTPEHFMKLAVALQRSNPPAAKSAIFDWLAKHPDDLLIRAFDADLALDSKDYSHAIEGYRTVLRSRTDDAVVMNNLAWSLFAKNDAEALSVAQKAVSLAPNNAAINDTLGWILVEQGRSKEGIDVLKRAAAAAPQQTSISLHLAKAQIKDGRKDEARATLQALVKSSPNTPQARESRALIASLGSS